MNTRRIQKELKEITEDPPYNCSAKLVKDDLHNWEGQIIGPSGTPYQEGIFKVSISFPKDYPFKPPIVTFLTKIYHCNVSTSTGEICLDILSSRWTPALTIGKVLLSICSLLNDPNPDDPLSAEIAQKLKSNKAMHDKLATEWTKKYANIK